MKKRLHKRPHISVHVNIIDDKILMNWKELAASFMFIFHVE